VANNEPILAKRSVYQFQMPLHKLRDGESKGCVSRARRSHAGMTMASVSPLLGPSLSSSAASSSKQSSLTEQEAREEEAKKEKLRACCIFTPGVLPGSRMIIYQLIDIEVDRIQKFIRDDPNDRVEISEKDGWLANGSIERIRAMMSEMVSKLLKKQRFKEGDDEEESLLEEVIGDLDEDEEMDESTKDQEEPEEEDSSMET
jgi:hypothetical protein